MVILAKIMVTVTSALTWTKKIQTKSQSIRWQHPIPLSFYLLFLPTLG